MAVTAEQIWVPLPDSSTCLHAVPDVEALCNACLLDVNPTQRKVGIFVEPGAWCGLQGKQPCTSCRFVSNGSWCSCIARQVSSQGMRCSVRVNT